MQIKQQSGLAITPASQYPLRGDCFNPAMLATAREAKFFTQTSLARDMGVSQALIGKWEAGILSPNDDQIECLAGSLGVQSTIFFVDRSRRLASMSDFYHRALAKAKRRDLKAIHARCCIVDIQIDQLLNLGELPEDRIPDIDPDNHAGNAEKIAMMSRTAMGVGSGPIKNLSQLIEQCGALVIDRKLEVSDVDALCRWVPELPKLFFVNGSRPADRIRFSLAHELGHTIMHFGRDFDPQLAEKHANDFASAFLMPAREIRRDLNPFMKLADLAALKRKWRVSMQAIARRAMQLKVIDENRYRYICIQISKKGWRKTEPVAISPEFPEGFSRLLQAHLDAGYSRKELSEILFVSESDVSNMLNDFVAPTREDQNVRLRLVR